MQKDVVFGVACLVITLGSTELIYGGTPAEFLDEKGYVCEDVSDISEIRYGNIIAYSVVCENPSSNSYSVYEYVPEQTVQTYHLGE